MKKLRWVLVVLAMTVVAPLLAQTTYYSRATGNWNVATTWSTTDYSGTAGTTTPVAGDIVHVGGGFTVTITGASAACATLTIASGSALNVGNGLAVSGTTTISGTLNINSSSGTKTFTGLVTLNSGAMWTEAVNAVVAFGGGITNNGTFATGTGNHNFNATQTLTGNFTIAKFVVTGSGVNVTNSGTITSNTQLTVTGANAYLINNGTISAQPVTISTVSARISNNGTLTIAGTLTGTGTSSFPQIVQGASSVLNLNGTTPTNVTVSGSGTTNTVNYGGGNQNVLNGSYNALNLSGSGSKSFQASTINITGGLTIGGTATVSGTGTTLNFSGTAQAISGASSLSVDNVQLSGSGTKNFNLNTVIASGISIGSGTLLGLSNSYTYTANTITINGGAQSGGTYGSTLSAASYKTDSFFSGSGLITIATGSHTYYSRASGDWTTTTTWSTLGFSYTENFGTYPVSGDAVNIGSNFSITVTGSQACGALTYSSANTGTTTLDVTSGSLTASGAVTIPRPTSSSASNILSVGAGMLSATALSFTGTTGGTQRLTISTGSVSISGNVSSASTSGTILFSAAGSISVGGSMFTATTGTLTTVAGATFSYNGSVAQTVQAFTYRHLSLSGTGAKSSATGTTNLGTSSTTDPGNLSIADNTSFSIGNATYNVYGTTTVGNGTSGSLNFVTSASGSKIFAGLVTINAGATWNDAISESFRFLNGINNSGTFTAGTGTYTFDTNNQSISGISSIPKLTVSTGSYLVVTVNGTMSSDNVTVTGGNNSLANNGNLTISTSLSGTGYLTQNAGATLNLGGTVSLSNGIVATNTGNTVNYTGADQTVATGNYYHLGLSGSGTKTLLTGTTSLGGNLTASGSVSFTGVANIAIAGNVNLGSSTTFTPSSFSYTVAGDWTSDGTLNGSGSTISFAGGNQTIYSSATTLFYAVSLAGTGTKTLSSAIHVDGNLSINSGVTVDLGSFAGHTAGTLSIAGVTQSAGTYGSSASTPTPDYINTVFATTTGYLTVNATVFYARADGDWGTASTWSNVTYNGAAASAAPGINDEVRIGGTHTVTVSSNASCKTLMFNDTGNEANNLTLSSGVVLTVSSNVTIPIIGTSGSYNGNAYYNALNVNAGTLNAGNIAFTNGATSNYSFPHRIVISTGTVNVSGNVTGSGVSARIQITGAGLLQLHGSIYTSSGAILTLATTSTVEYAGTNQTVRDAGNTSPSTYYGNLTISGTGTKTWSLGAARTVSGNLTVNSGTTLETSGNALTVTGSTTVSGALTTSAGVTVTGSTTLSGSWTMSGTQTKSFAGDVTLNSGSSWVLSAVAPCTFSGNLVNNATTFTPNTGIYTFSGTGKTMSGTFSLANVTVNGTYTNLGALTSTATLAGSGTLTNGASATLNIGGTSTIAGFYATASNNTVNYNGTGAQTVYTPVGFQYQNLSFNNTTANGIATMPATIYVGGNLTNNGAVSVGGFYGFNPNSGTVVFNGSTTQSIQGTASSIFNNLTSNSAVSVTVLSTANLTGTLHLLTGNFINSASLTLGNGATINRDASATFTGSVPLSGVAPSGNYYNLIYSGSGSISTGAEAQGSHVKDVTVSLTGTLTQSSALDLYGILLVNSGATYDPGTSLLTVKSWSDVGTDAGGSIGTISGTFVSNPVTVERYFRPKDNKDRFFSSPVTNATVAQLQESFAVTGNFTGTSYPCTGCSTNNASLHWYKESTSGNLKTGYQNYPTTNNSAILAPGVGYDAYMWDGLEAETVLFRGPINKGDIDNLGTATTGQVVSKTVVGAGTASADGWNLIGNPYPAPIKWTGSSSGGWTLTNIASQAWAWDVYNEVWIAIDSGSDIAISQAFWVLVNTVGSGTINITEAAKSSARSGAYYREGNTQSMIRWDLSDGSTTESTYMVANEKATSRYSLDYDFPKIELGVEKMHMTLVKDNQHLGFYGFNNSMIEQDIPVRIVAGQEGVYELSVQILGDTPPDLTGYYLVDLVNQERVAFDPTMRYSFNYSKKHPEQRFLLTKNVDASNTSAVAVSAFPNPTTGKFNLNVNAAEPVLSVDLLSAAGNLISKRTNMNDASNNLELSLEDQPNGVYLVKIRLASGVVVKRIIKH